MEKNQFYKILLDNNICLTDQMKEQFDLYFSLLCKYNKIMDLTAVKDEDIYERHFLNSLSIAFNNDFNNLSLCDVGSGAGFPAIPLKIIFPNMKLTIVDSLSKRMDFLKIVIDSLKLKNVTIITNRVEQLSVEYYETFDVVTARAVARLDILLELICQLVKVNGLFIAMKGEKAMDELQMANNAIKILNFKLINSSLFYPSINLFLSKTSHCDKKFPRNYSQIKKNPL